MFHDQLEGKQVWFISIFLNSVCNKTITSCQLVMKTSYLIILIYLVSSMEHITTCHYWYISNNKKAGTETSISSTHCRSCYEVSHVSNRVECVEKTVFCSAPGCSIGLWLFGIESSMNSETEKVLVCVESEGSLLLLQKSNIRTLTEHFMSSQPYSPF